MHRATDPTYLAEQYANSDRLLIRAETHRRFTVWPGVDDGRDVYQHELLRHLRLNPGLRLLDVGCGPGSFHRTIREQGVHDIVGIDRSLGMVREASVGAYAQADAQALPFADGSFERVLANHMLFHVPDQHQALAEMRRVLRPGGRVVIGTNAAHFMPQLTDLHAAACAALGFEPADGSTERFTLDDVDLVRSVFPNAQVHALEAALVFPSLEPAVRFYGSGAVDRVDNRPADNSHRQPLIEDIGRRIAQVIAREGEFRVAKTSGWFTADT